jgi:hypothetical protein
LGFLVGQRLNANFGGSVAMAALVVFLAVLLVAPRDGLISRSIRQRRQGRAFEIDLLLVHLASHLGTEAEALEADPRTLHAHLRWGPERTERVLRAAFDAGYVAQSGHILQLTASGRERADQALAYEPAKTRSPIPAANL